MSERSKVRGTCESENFPCVCGRDKDHELPHQCFECSVDWDDDGNEWIGVTAVMRTFGQDEFPLEMRYLNEDLWCVEIPGMGALVVTRSDEGPRADKGLLTNGPDYTQERTVVRDVHEIRCELLHKEDRLCVVIKRERA